MDAQEYPLIPASSFAVKVWTEPNNETPEAWVEFGDGTHVALYRSPEDGRIYVHIDAPAGDLSEHAPVLAFNEGYTTVGRTP